MAQASANTVTKKNEEEWYGEGYGISKEKWIACLKEPGVFNANILQLLQRWLAHGGTLSCKKYSELYNTSPSAPIMPVVCLGKRIQKLTACKVKIGSDGKEVYFSTPFLGRYNEDGFYDWKMRPELVEAMKELKLDTEGATADGKTKKQNEKRDIPYSLNTIFYGPPGTGKTHRLLVDVARKYFSDSSATLTHTARNAGLVADLK